MSLARPSALVPALLLVAGVASLAPVSSEAVLLWKRKQLRAGTAGAEHVGEPLGPGLPPVPAAHPAGVGLAASVASALGAPAEVPSPNAAATYPHERRLLEPAAQALDEAFASGSPALADAYVVYGNALARAGSDAFAAAAYREALELAPEHLEAWNNLGAVARREGLLDLAEQTCHHVIAIAPRSGLAWFNLGLTLDRLGEWEESEQAYVRALELEPALWLPQRNPLIVGNERARRALHLLYLERGVSGTILLAEPR